MLGFSTQHPTVSCGTERPHLPPLGPAGVTKSSPGMAIVTKPRFRPSVSTAKSRYFNNLRLPHQTHTRHEWIIEGAGKGRYRFKLVAKTRIVPRDDLVVINVPDATPELIRAYKLDDEQALLAIVRYNRLIDTFLGLTTYSLQNHLRTTVEGMGQIEIDELYIGLDKHGCHYVIPVQAKGGRDQIGIVQTAQDIRFAEQKFPGMRCRAIAAQFLGACAVGKLTTICSSIRSFVTTTYGVRRCPKAFYGAGS